jgi:hypothetical protein
MPVINEIPKILGKSAELKSSIPKFEILKERWQTGDIPSHEFLPLVLARLLSASNYIDTEPIKNIPLETLIKKSTESPSLNQAYQTGYTGENPPPDIFRRYYQFLPQYQDINRRTHAETSLRYPEVNFPPYKIDSLLPSSLPAHATLARKALLLYSQNKEIFYFNPVFKTLTRHISEKDPLWNTVSWLYLHQLTSHIRRLKVETLLSVKAFDSNNTQYFFPDLEHFFQRLSPISYLDGWEDRLNPLLGKLTNSLPAFLKTDHQQQILLTTFFMRNPEKLSYMDKILHKLVSGANPIDTANILLNSDQLKSWEILLLKKQPVTSIINAPEYAEIVAHNAEEAKQIMAGFCLLFWGAISILGYEPAVDNLTIKVISSDKRGLAFSMLHGTFPYQVQPLPEKIIARDIHTNQQTELERNQAYNILSQALLHLPPLDASDTTWTLESVNKIVSFGDSVKTFINRFRKPKTQN